MAREAGVSHAAPTHHFGDLTGLVSELAAIGFRQFNAAMVAAGAAAGSALMEKALARAKAYVAYAQAHPGMYGLMFRTERLDMTRPSLHEAAEASFAGLAGAIGASRRSKSPSEALSLDQAAAIARAWSLVHGFTMLLLDDRLPTSCGGSPRAPTPKPCWMPCCARPSAGRRALRLAPRASSTARPLSPITFTSSLAAFEIAGVFVGGLAGKLIGVGIGLHVDIGDMAHRARAAAASPPASAWRSAARPCPGRCCRRCASAG